MAEFKPGDVVHLKSGGPTMTVTRMEDEYGTMKVSCTWFDDKGEQKFSSFEPEIIELIEN